MPTRILSAILIMLFLMPLIFLFFFFNDTATTEIYTLSLHDALPISPLHARGSGLVGTHSRMPSSRASLRSVELLRRRSEEHTSELQSRLHLVCRLLLEKKKTHSARRTWLHRKAAAG